MRKNVKSTLILALVYIFSISLGHAFDLDETVDDEIRKNYNPTQLINDVSTKETALDKKIQSSTNNIKTHEETLPSLPNITKYGNSTKQSDIRNNSISPVATVKPYTGGNIKVKSGTSFDVISNAKISDWQRKGTKIKFTSTANVSGNGYTIPRGTTFNAEIIESHQPQITCNGGLVIIKVYSMNYKGKTIPLSAYVTKANNKKIFFNNIKGERNYLKTTWKKGNWGRAMFDKMLSVSIGLGAESSTLILTPFPFVYGTLCFGANALTSPICAFFSKGGHVSIPENSHFKVKLVDDVMID